MSIKNYPLCTVIIPMYNSQDYILTALKSITNNDKHDQLINVIIIDDFSTDNSLDIVNKFAVNHKNFSVYRKASNGNWGSVINFVRNNKLIKTKYAIVLDSDDSLTKNFTNLLVKYVVKNDYDFLIFRSLIKYKKLKFVLNPKIFTKKLSDEIFSPVLIPCSILFSSKIFYKTHELEESVAYQDYSLYNQLITHSVKPTFINKINSLYWYTRPGNSMTSEWTNKRKEAEQKLFNILKKDGKAYQFVFRFMLPKFIEGLKMTNSKIFLLKDNIDDSINKMSFFGRRMLKRKIKKAIKVGVFELVFSTEKINFI